MILFQLILSIIYPGLTCVRAVYLYHMQVHVWMLIIQSVNINFNTHFQIIVVIFKRMKDVCKFKFKCEWIHLYQFHSTIVILNASMIENNKIFDLIWFCTWIFIAQYRHTYLFIQTTCNRDTCCNLCWWAQKTFLKLLVIPNIVKI